MKKTGLVAAVLWTVSTVLSAQVPRGQQIDAIFAAWDKPDSPGCTVGVVYGGEVVHAKGYGSANLDYGIPLGPKSVFYIASTSKQFAAAAIALLALEEKLSLDDDVRKYLPEIPDYGSTITLRHLVHHTSGLRDYLGLLAAAGVPYSEPVSNAEALKVIARQSATNFPAGERFSYSNSGYVALALVVERVAGKTLGQFAHERFFVPLGMTDTHFGEDLGRIVENRVVSYSMHDGEFERHLKTITATGDGNLLTNVLDLAKWDANFYTGEVGGQELLELLHRRGKTNDGEDLDYAFGLFLDEHADLPTVHHAGGFLGFRTQFVRFPDQQLSVIVLCNHGVMNPTPFAYRVADLYLGEVAQAQPTEESRAPRVPNDFAHAVAGYYRDVDGQLARIVHQRGVLSLQLDRKTTPLRQDGGRRLTGADTGITLDESLEGPVPRIVIDGSGTYTRVPAAEPDAAELAQYEGSYASAELDATYVLRVEGEQLVRVVANLDDLLLTPTIRDRFDSNFFGGTGFVFQRDASGLVDGFYLESPRMEGLAFRRR